MGEVERMGACSLPGHFIPRLEGAEDCTIKQNAVNGATYYKCFFLPLGTSAVDMQKDFVRLVRLVEKATGGSAKQLGAPYVTPTEERHIVVGQIDVHEQWHQGTTEFLPLDTRSRLSVWVDSDPSPNYQPPAASSSGGSEIDEIVKSGRYTPMPTAQRVGSSGSGLASIKVTNNTAYTLSLVYEGISSQTLTIPARNTATIQLPAGSFRVLGRVSAPGVLPFIGSEILGPGDSLVSRFFIK